MSELRLYCDLLVQQVDKTKEVTTTGVSSSEVKPKFPDGFKTRVFKGED